MKKYILYVLLGLIFVLPGEFFLKILVEKKAFDALQNTLFSYLIFLTLVFLIQIFLRSIIKRNFTFLLINYIGWGFLGLFFIEWALLSNAPWINGNASQIGMFTWWGMLSIFPILASTKTLGYPMRKRIWIFWVILTTLTLVPILVLKTGGEYISLIVFSYGTILYNYFLYKYLKSIRKF